VHGVLENRPKSEKWASLTPQPYVVGYKKVERTAETPWPLNYNDLSTRSKHYLSTVYPVTYSLL